MEPRIVERPSFPIAGLAIRTSEEENRQHGIIPAFWQRVRRDGKFWARLEPVAAGTATLGLSADFDGRTFAYWIARELRTGAAAPAGMQTLVVPAQRYAVFTAAGRFPQSVWAAVDFAHNDWLKRPGHRRTGGPDFEWYDERYDVRASSGEVDLYIPIE